MRNIQINKVLDEAVKLMQEHLEARGIKVCKVRQAKVSSCAEESALLLCFTRILQMAAQSMHYGGQIDISIQSLELTSRNAGKAEKSPWMIIRIRDYGPGIALLKFGQVQMTGANLGGQNSATCEEIKRVIETQHLGRVSLRNHETQGLEVVIEMPVLTEDARVELLRVA